MSGIAQDLIGEIDFPIFRGGASHVLRQQADAARAAKTFRRTGFSQNAQNLWRVSQGANSIIVKKIHNGGTHTGKQLRNQIDYLFSKSQTIFGNMVDLDAKSRTLSVDQRDELIAQWSDEWGGDPKNGHTTHLLVSFPVDVAAHRVPPIVEQWCSDLFQSGSVVEGEEWAYVAALHTDRDNVHVHVVINNRGVENNTWFYMAKGHDFDLDMMKQRLVDIASDHGMYLEKSSRLERGILTYGPSRAEIERAAREEREPVEKLREGRALQEGLRQIEKNSRTLRQLASIAVLISDDELATKIQDAAEILENGGIISNRNQEIVMDAQTIKNRGDLASAFDAWLDETEKDLSKLPPAEQRDMRSEFYSIASDIVRNLGDDRGAQLMHQEPRSVIYQTQITDSAVSSMGAEKEIGAAGVTEARSRIANAAKDTGLDAGVIQERLNTGAANAWQEGQWVRDDMLSVADTKGFDLSSGSARQKVAEIVDSFYHDVARVVSQAVAVEYAPQNDRLTRTLGAMANAHQTHGKVEFEHEDHAERFGRDFRDRYGENSMNRIAAGDTNALAIDFPDESNRQEIARAVVAAAKEHETVGMTLEQVKAAEMKLNAHEKDSHEHSRNKDHGYEL